MLNDICRVASVKFRYFFIHRLKGQASQDSEELHKSTYLNFP
jgi:hypothetical protein